jgi:hypothetical protein
MVVTPTPGGRRYWGPLTAPAAASYLHDLPDAPEGKWEIKQLGSDYYGRGLLRISTTGAETLDETLLQDVLGGEGDIRDPSSMTSDRTSGLFQAQKAFRGWVVFQAFDAVARSEDGAVFTIGVSNVRPSDNAASVPKLIPFTLGSIDD